MAIEIKLNNGAKKTHLIFSEIKFNELGVETESKIGAKRIEHEKAAQALEWARSHNWEFDGEPLNGYYNMLDLGPKTAATAATTVGANELVK